MAQDTLTIKGMPLEAAGMNDNTPLESEPNFYQTRGVHSLSERCLQRCNGKRLVSKYSSPVLAIHGDLRTRIYIETTTQILMLDTLQPDTVTFVDTSSVHWSETP